LVWHPCGIVVVAPGATVEVELSGTVVDVLASVVEVVVDMLVVVDTLVVEVVVEIVVGREDVVSMLVVAVVVETAVLTSGIVIINGWLSIGDVSALLGSSRLALTLWV
jgi:hypothetical protein